jgi:hypothetical protein
VRLLEPPAVVGDSKDDAVTIAAELDHHLGRVAVAGDVRQALLSHAVEDELDIRMELSELVVDSPLDVKIGSSREDAGEVADGTCEAQMVERFGA